MPKASSSETGGQRPSALEMFTDRVQEQELLREIMRPEPTKAERGELFLTVFYGVGGVGKSTLCRRAYEIAKEQDAKELVLVTVDYDGSGWSPETAFVGVVNELVRAFADKGVAPRLSGSLLALYAQHDSRTGGESISDDERWGLAMESLDKGVELAGIPGLGLLLKGAKWVKDRAQRGALQKQIRELGLWPEEQFGRVDLIDLEAKIGRALFEDVRGYLNGSPNRHVRLLIDGFERLQSHERKADAQMRLQEFLGYFAASKDHTTCNRFRVLIFGREKLRWDELYDDDDWRRFWNQHLLAGLAERDARDFLGRYRQWFQTHGQQPLATALTNYEEQILDATDEQAQGERMFYPFYLNLAVELLERSVSRGEKPDLGRAPGELQDRFFKYLDPAELRVLMVLGLAEVFDEALYDWLAKEGVIKFPLHSFHTAVRKEHSYFQAVENSTDTWRFHRLFEQALQAKWLAGDAQRREGQAVTLKLLAYYAKALEKVPERDWTEREVECWRRAMEIIVTQGAEKQLLGQQEWTLLIEQQPWNTTHYLCTNYNLAFIERVLIEQERLLGPKHPNTLDNIYKFAVLLDGKGYYDSAEPLYRRALVGLEETIGGEHPNTLRSVFGLGKLLHAKDNYQEALALYHRALEIQEKILGKVHVETLKTRNNLGVLLWNRCDFVGAQVQMRIVLEVQEKIYGDEHPDTLKSLNDLGELLRGKGDYKEAEVLFRRALAGREKVLGAQHPDTLESVSSLGGLLKAKGDYEEAEKFLRRALAGNEKVLGDEHPYTLLSIGMLGNTLLAKGEYIEAEAHIRQALAVEEKVFGVAHSQTLSSVSALGDLLHLKCDYNGAEALHRRALEGMEKLFGLDHADVLVYTNLLGKTLSAKGDYLEAEVLSRRALKGLEKVFIGGHPRIWDCLDNLGGVQIARCDYGGAEVFYRRALEGREKSFGIGHPDTLASIGNLAFALRSKGDCADAAAIVRQYYDYGESTLRYSLACYECLCGNLDETRRLLAEEFLAYPESKDAAFANEDLAILHNELSMLAANGSDA